MSTKKKMFNKITGVMLSFIALAGAVLAPSSKVNAESAVFLTLEERRDITIIVGFDTERPKVAFIDPSGDRYEAYEDFDAVMEADTKTYYNIAGAEAGDWTIEYDKGSNAEISVDVYPWHRSIAIQSLTVELENTEEALPNINCTLSVDYPGGSYNYIISAVVMDQDGNITSRIKMEDGSVWGDDDYTVSVYPDMLPDGQYLISAEVWAEDDTGTEVRDAMIAQTAVNITGNTAEGEAERISVTYNVTDQYADIVFNGTDMDPRCDEFAIIVMQGDEKISERSFEDEEYTDHVIIDPDGGEVLVQVNGHQRDGGFVTWNVKFAPKMPVALSIETPATTNDLTAVVNFDAGEKEYQGAIKVGDKSTAVLWKGKDTVQVSLETLETNDVELDVTSDRVTYVMTQAITVDTIPPTIDLYGVTGDMKSTEEQALFTGQTDPSATLTCNGKEVELESDGSFSFVEELKDGANEFKFEATDKSGNVTSRNVKITKVDEIGGKEAKKKMSGLSVVLTVLVMFVIAFGTAGIAILIMRRSEKRLGKSNAVSAVIKSIGIMAFLLFTGLGIWQLILHFNKKGDLEGPNLVEMLKKSTWTEIASEIDSSSEYLYSSFISFGIALLILILFIVFLVLGKKKRKKKE